MAAEEELTKKKLLDNLPGLELGEIMAQIAHEARGVGDLELAGKMYKATSADFQNLNVRLDRKYLLMIAEMKRAKKIRREQVVMEAIEAAYAAYRGGDVKKKGKVIKLGPFDKFCPTRVADPQNLIRDISFK